MSELPLENLRAAFIQSAVATLATQMGAYLRLVSHADVQLSDLLGALDRGPVIGDDAARRLHACLGVPGPGTAPVVQRAYWEQVLRERAINPAEPLRTVRAIPVSTEAARG